MSKDEETQQHQIYFRMHGSLPLLISGYTGPSLIEFERNQLECRLLYEPPEREIRHFGTMKFEMSSRAGVSGNLAALFRVFRDFEEKQSLDRSAEERGIVHTSSGNPNAYSRLPSKITNLVFDVHARATQVRADVIKAFRWRFALEGKPMLNLPRLTLEWSVDEVVWFNCPYIEDMHMKIIPVTSFDASRHNEVIDAIQNGQPMEPFAHEIMREAYSVVESSFRSALLLGISAVETRLREFLMKSPQPTPWFLEQRGAIRTEECLTGLLNIIVTVPPAIAGEKLIPKNVVLHLKRAIRCRDRIAHGKEHSLTKAELSGYLQVAQDILWFLDYYDGHMWARQHLSASAKLGTDYMTTEKPVWPV